MTPPDRYGDDDATDVPPFARRDRIDECGLCDGDGLRDGFQCDHRDHAAAAKRGMAMVRQAMGWTK